MRVIRISKPFESSLALANKLLSLVLESYLC